MFSIHCSKENAPPTGPSGPGPLVTITIAPNPDTVIVFGTQAFTAVGKDSAGAQVTVTATWSVVGAAGSISSSGLFTAGSAPGSATIRATSGTVSGSAAVVVRAATTPAGALATISLAPNPASVAVSGTQQFAAAGKDAQGNNVSVTPTWTVTGSGTITSSGLFTAGTAAGTATVKATSGSVSGTAAVTVTAPVATIATIVVSPNNETVATSSTLQFSAVGKDAAGNAVTFTPTWSVSGGGTINGSGLFTAGATAATSTVRAAQGDVAGTTTVVVSGTRLVFASEPGPTPAGYRILSRLIQPGACNAADTHVLPITVRAVDQSGHLVPNGVVTLKLGSNPSGGMLSGTLSESGPNSYVPSDVVFNEVRISAVGHGYTLIASSPGKASATSTPFDIAPSPNSLAVRLFFDKVVCTSGEHGVHVWRAGTTSSNPIEVTPVDDAWRLDYGLDGGFPGNVVTSYSGPVTISVDSGGALGGTLTLNAVNGRATFSDLVPRDTGYYVLAARAPGLILHKWTFHVTP